MSSYLTPEQYAVLMHPKGIHKDRVSSRDGYAYVEAHDIKAEMIRVFGWERWSWKINTCHVQREQETVTRSSNNAAWFISALVHGTLTVCAPDGTVLATYDGVHAGSSTHPQYGEALGNAVTNADSYAFKRAAIMALGTQGGLGLYNRGSRDEIVRWTAVKPEGSEDDKEANPDDAAVISPESLELPESQPDPRITSQPATPEPPAAPKPDPEEKEQVRRQTAAEIRALAVSDRPDGYASPARWVAHLMGEAVKRGVLDVPVESLLSPTQVKLKVFLEQVLKQQTAPDVRERTA